MSFQLNIQTVCCFYSDIKLLVDIKTFYAKNVSENVPINFYILRAMQ